jgi:hypothetical protein
MADGTFTIAIHDLTNIPINIVFLIGQRQKCVVRKLFLSMVVLLNLSVSITHEPYHG